jgi:hypothetical protein
MNSMLTGDFNGHLLKIQQGGKIYLYLSNEEQVQLNRETIGQIEIIDESSMTTTNTTNFTHGTSRKGTKSMLGRAVVGSILTASVGGVVGGVVGAATAKNKINSVTSGTTTKSTSRTFKALVSFKDNRQALLQLNDYGYEQLIIAQYAPPYADYIYIKPSKWASLKVFSWIAGTIIATIYTHGVALLLVMIWFLFKVIRLQAKMRQHFGITFLEHSRMSKVERKQMGTEFRRVVGK